MTRADTIERIQSVLDTVAAPYVQALGLKVSAIDGDRTTLTMPVTPALVHGGGVLCGQAVLAAADTAMVVATSVSLGEFKPMTTVQLQTTFLRPVPGDTGELTIVCRVLRRGRTLAFGEIEVFTPDGKLAAHATTTYAFL
jgi:uncharacterized protein (TIGR00369 family)